MSSGNNEQNKEVNDIELVIEEVDISVEDSLSEEVADNEVDEEIVVGESTEDSAEDSELDPDEIAQEESESSVEEIDPPTYEELQSENEELKTQLEALSGRLRTVSEAFHKKSDEVADTKKRLERQGEFNKTRLRGDVVSTMFAPFENLKRSIEACEKAEVDEAMVSGLLMVRDEIWTSLKNLGLEEIPGVGSLFNPSIHEALTSIPVQDPVLNDTIIQVYSTGYRINDLVVKTAQVIIGKYYAPPKEEVIEVLEGEEVEDSEATEESEVIDESNTDEVEE